LKALFTYSIISSQCGIHEDLKRELKVHSIREIPTLPSMGILSGDEDLKRELKDSHGQSVHYVSRREDLKRELKA